MQAPHRVRRHGSQGGFWWGYPYPYPYYGYPVGYYPGESYEKVGKEWGKELRKGKATLDQFVTFVQLDLLKASDSARSHFQVGFLKGYGRNGLGLFTKALSQAKADEPQGPTMQAPLPAAPPAGAPAAKTPLTEPQ